MPSRFAHCGSDAPSRPQGRGAWLVAVVFVLLWGCMAAPVVEAGPTPDPAPRTGPGPQPDRAGVASTSTTTSHRPQQAASTGAAPSPATARASGSKEHRTSARTSRSTAAAPVRSPSRSQSTPRSTRAGLAPSATRGVKGGDDSLLAFAVLALGGLLLASVSLLGLTRRAEIASPP